MNRQSYTKKRPHSTINTRKVKALMILRGFKSVRALAEHLGVSSSYANNVVTGIDPSMRMRARIAEALHVPVHAITTLHPSEPNSSPVIHNQQAQVEESQKEDRRETDFVESSTSDHAQVNVQAA